MFINKINYTYFHDSMKYDATYQTYDVLVTIMKEIEKYDFV